MPTTAKHGGLKLSRSSPMQGTLLQESRISPAKRQDQHLAISLSDHLKKEQMI